MTSSNSPMTRDEMIELAPLDALGLLDAYEAALFTRSFHLAPRSVQDEIRALQAAVAEDETLLAAVSPPPGMRDRVLPNIHAAIAAEIDLAPLAVIGSVSNETSGGLLAAASGQTSGPQDSGESLSGLNGHRPMSTVSGSEYVAAAVAPSRRQRRASGPGLWRFVAFGLAASLIAGVFFGIQIQNQNNRLIEAVVQQKVLDDLEDLVGPSLAQLMADPSAQQVRLSPVDESLNASAHAVVFINDETGEAFLFAMGLPEGSDCSLVARRADGSIIKRAAMDSVRSIHGQPLGRYDDSVAMASVSWTIERDGDVLMRA